MRVSRKGRTALVRMPRRLRALFWDYDFARLTWPADSELIIGRILASGDWGSVCWLLRVLSRPALRSWLERRRGGALSARQLRFWQVILDLPRAQVDAWVADPAHRLWEQRCVP